MSNKVKDIDIKNQTYYFFNDIINIKNFDPNNVKVDEVIQKDSYLLHWICDHKRFEINNVNPLYFIFVKVSGYFGEIHKSKYLTLVPSNESKEKRKK